MVQVNLGKIRPRSLSLILVDLWTFLSCFFRILNRDWLTYLDFFSVHKKQWNQKHLVVHLHNFSTCESIFSNIYFLTYPLFTPITLLDLLQNNLFMGQVRYREKMINTIEKVLIKLLKLESQKLKP